jgi:hypothetical protein
MSTGLEPRDLAHCGLFGAAALLLPMLFHALHLGSVFMPMYLPLVMLAFYVRPGPAALTALVTPMLSAVVTGMPPLYPPVAVFMALELAVMSALIAAACSRWPRINPWAVLIPVLLLGRVLYVAMVYGVSLVIELPAGFMARLSFVRGWPGIVLILLVVPGALRIGRTPGTPHPAAANAAAKVPTDA